MQAPAVAQNSRLLETITVISNFVRRFHNDYQTGNAFSGYSQQEFPLPDSLRQVVMSSIMVLENSSLVQRYLTILRKPDRLDRLIDAYMNSYINQGHRFTDMNFIEWTIMCCLVSAVLHDGGFREAPDIAIETIGGICCLYGRFDAFRNFGFDV